LSFSGGFPEDISTERDTSASSIEKAQLQEEITLSSKNISQLEKLKTELEKKNHGVESQVKSLDSEKSLNDSRIAKLQCSPREVEIDRDSFAIQFNQCHHELNEAMGQLNENLSGVAVVVVVVVLIVLVVLVVLVSISEPISSFLADALYELAIICNTWPSLLRNVTKKMSLWVMVVVASIQKTWKLPF
jgi:hypothetical protein